MTMTGEHAGVDTVKQSMRFADAEIGPREPHQLGFSVGDMRISPAAKDGRVGRLLSVEEAAEYIGVRPGTLRNWLSARRIAYVKVGRLTRLSSDTLNRFIAEHTVASVEEVEP